MKSYSREYTGRQLDIECLQTIAVPVGEVEVSLTATTTDTRRITGMQKVVQRYAALLLTPSATIPFAKAADNFLLTALRQGVVSNEGYLQHLFSLANAATLDTMHNDDYNISSFGNQPDDEYLERVELRDVTVDYSTSTLGLSLTLTTKAGEDYSYVLPVGTSNH